MNKKKGLIRYCPVCLQESKFVRVVEAHEETHIPDNPIIGPGSGHQIVHYIKITKLPIAHCSICDVVIHVGPSVAKVKKDFEEKRKRQEAKDTKSTIPPEASELLKRLSKPK